MIKILKILKILKIFSLFSILAIILNFNISMAIDEENNEQEVQQVNEYTGIKGTQSAEDGTYKIIPYLNLNKAIDIQNSSTESEAQIALEDNKKSDNQKFEVIYDGDGFYKIKSKVSNKVLTIENEEPSIGTKIIQKDDEDLDTQKWILKESTNSVYQIISKCGNLYMEIPTTNIQNGEKIQLNTETKSNQQLFVMVNQTPKKNIVHIEDGIYQLEVKGGKVIDISGYSQENGGNPLIYMNKKTQNQKFHITRIKNTDYYKIVAVHSAKCLEAEAEKITPRTKVVQYNYNGKDNQLWLLKNAGNGYYNIISKDSGLYLDVYGGLIDRNGARINLYYNKNDDAQKFKLNKIEIIKNNTYEIETKLDKNKVIDIASSSTKDGGNALLWKAHNVNNQRYIFTALSSDTYKIIAKHSGKALTVNTKNNNVYQSTYTGKENQKWKIEEIGNLYYRVISKSNGLTLNVLNGKSNNGQNIEVNTIRNNNAQAFKFVSGFRKFYEEGTYGKSGLKIKGDKRGTNLKYYKIGKGSKRLFATFSIHGFEDSYAHDGKELTFIAEEFKNYLKNNITEKIVNSYTIYIFPCLNPDGQIYGKSQDGPGRTTLYSNAPKHKGIDMNRNWSVGYVKQKNSRNYSGTSPFQAYEAKALRNFILKHEGKKNILIDTHGWLEETMGNGSLGKYYRKQFGLKKHISSYGRGYLINWARTLKKGKSALIELPEVKNHKQVVNRKYATKWINATMKMLKEN